MRPEHRLIQRLAGVCVNCRCSCGWPFDGDRECARPEWEVHAAKAAKRGERTMARYDWLGDPGELEIDA